MEHWLVTPRGEVHPLQFDLESPEELCIPDKPLNEVLEVAEEHAIQPGLYITYKRYQLAAESGRLGIVYSVRPPTVGDMQLISAYRSGLEFSLRLT
jgi:hypothetical protein